MYTIQYVKSEVQPLKRADKGKETIHSGHFMVSHFEAEEQDDEDNVAVPIPEVDTKSVVTAIVPLKQWSHGSFADTTYPKSQQQVAIDTSLSKLFQCMSLAYRQKLTSPKWNRFRGIRLRWKDKIRLNNVIWRCWHLQFVKKENTLICQFASPLDVDTHNKPEAIVLEGKYWKRKLAAVTAEYKKWRMFYRNNLLGHTPRESIERLNELDQVLWDSNSSDHMNMMVDEDYMDLMSDTLFSTITNQPFVFPDSREIAKAGYADFIQPSLGPLQPNLDDYMDTFDPLQEFMNSKLPTVPEEQTQPVVGWGYLVSGQQPVQISEVATTLTNVGVSAQYPLNEQVIQPLDKPYQESQNIYNGIIMQPQNNYNNLSATKSKMVSQSSEQSRSYVKHMENSSYAGYPTSQSNIVQKESPQQSPVQDSQMLSQQSFRQPSTSQGYKFTEPTRPNIKFSSQHHPQHAQSMMHPSSSCSTHIPYHHSGLPPSFPTSGEDKLETRRRGAPRGRGRSRSTTREPLKRPPLISAVSDPSLMSPSTNVLLSHLLSNNSPQQHLQDPGVYPHTQSRGSCPNVAEQFRIKEEGGASGTIPILPMPSPSSSSSSPGMPLCLSSQITITPLPMQAVTDPLILNTYSNSSSPIDPSSQHCLHSPTSSQESVGSPSRDGGSSRDRRVGHIHAEQKRRYNIKNGFDMIYALIPHLNQNPNAKLSKAAMLQKGADYIKQLRAERHQIQEEMDSLKQQIESLNQSISNCQSMLPATGAPVSRRRDSKIKERFEEYVARRTMENWKFWIFSLICRPLLDSFSNFVSTASMEELYSSTLHWVEQHCTLVDLRPVVLNSLRYLCTKTDILSDPDKLPDEARKLVLEKDRKKK